MVCAQLTSGLNPGSWLLFCLNNIGGVWWGSDQNHMQQLLLLSGPCGPLSKDGEFSELLIFLVSFICHLGPRHRLVLQQDPKGRDFGLWM